MSGPTAGVGRDRWAHRPQTVAMLGSLIFCLALPKPGMAAEPAEWTLDRPGMLEAHDPARPARRRARLPVPDRRNVGRIPRLRSAGLPGFNVISAETAPPAEPACTSRSVSGASLRFGDRTARGPEDPAPRTWPTPDPARRHPRRRPPLARNRLRASPRPRPSNRAEPARRRPVVYAGFAVRNVGSAKRTAHLWLHFGDTSHVASATSASRVPSRPAIPHRYEPPHGRLGEKVRYVLPTPERPMPLA